MSGGRDLSGSESGEVIGFCGNVNEVSNAIRSG
jgi:hypothetical protein